MFFRENALGRKCRGESVGAKVSGRKCRLTVKPLPFRKAFTELLLKDIASETEIHFSMDDEEVLRLDVAPCRSCKQARTRSLAN